MLYINIYFLKTSTQCSWYFLQFCLQKFSENGRCLYWFNYILFNVLPTSKKYWTSNIKFQFYYNISFIHLAVLGFFLWYTNIELTQVSCFVFNSRQNYFKIWDFDFIHNAVCRSRISVTTSKKLFAINVFSNSAINGMELMELTLFLCISTLCGGWPNLITFEIPIIFSYFIFSFSYGEQTAQCGICLFFLIFVFWKNE